jgi:hypothetical protein
MKRKEHKYTFYEKMGELFDFMMFVVSPLIDLFWFLITFFIAIFTFFLW